MSPGSQDRRPAAAAAAGAKAQRGDKSSSFKIGEGEKRATEACTSATEYTPSRRQRGSLAAEVEKLGGVGKKLAAERADALEGGAEDTTKID